MMPRVNNGNGTKNWVRTQVPDFYGLKAFVINGAFYGACVSLMAEAGFSRSLTVEDADIVVFIGGADVDPKMYNQKCLAATSFNKERDALELFYYQKALKLGKIMFGICRGAQFLHVMNGGELWQDVNNHAGIPHLIVDIEEDYRLSVTSLHHQMLKPNDKITIMAVTEKQIATRFEDENLIIDLKGKGANAEHETEIEAGCYENTRCFFVQGHPEIGSAQYRAWTMQKLHDFYYDFQPFKYADEPDLAGISEEINYLKEIEQRIG